MMSVSCSKTLIFAPECWKCILRGLDFINFPGGGGGGRGMPLDYPRNRHLCLLQNFCHLLNKLIETLLTHDYIHRKQRQNKTKGTS